MSNNLQILDGIHYSQQARSKKDTYYEIGS